MDFNPNIPSVDPNAAMDMHPLDYLQQLASQQSMPSMPSLPQAKPVQSTGDGWRGLLHMLAPVIGAVAVGGGGPKQTGFMNGYSEGQQAVQEEKRRKDQESQRKSAIAADYMLKISDHAQQISDPVAFQKFADLADAAFVKAGYGQPGEIKNQLSFNSSSLAKKQLKELSDQLAGLDKAGYNLDELASSGATLKLTTGQDVPIGTAMDITRARPYAGGQPIAKPTKAAATAEERFLQKWAKENGLKVEDLTSAQELDARTAYAGAGRSDTPPAGSDFNQFLKRWAKDNGKTVDQVTSADEMAARKAFNDSTKDPQLTDINLALKQLQLEALQRKAKEAGQVVDIQPGSPYYKYVEDLASGDLTFSQFNRMITTRGGGGANVNALKASIYGKAAELNPNFSPAAFEMGYKFASSPKVMAQVASVNNVLSGVPDLLKASDEAKRLGATSLNGFVVKGGIAIGKQKYSDFKTAQTAFADELSGALGYGSATDMSREMGFSMTDPNLSPDNFRSAVEKIIVPFVKRKKISMQGQMGPYGQDKTPDGTPATGKTYQLVNGKWVLQ